jgi:DNA (cytosine-5)-methyltransferase 1
MREAPFEFYEFFAGGGMARLGLGKRWRCLFSNEISAKKAHAYRANFGPSPELRVEDIWKLEASDLPSGAVLSWASFPCQDLSLAGNGAGLNGHRSGTFTAFWNLMLALQDHGRGVPLIVLENVVGTLTANGGRDFQGIVRGMVRSGYRVGAMVVDAVHFLPQSRPRLFLVAVREDIRIPESLLADRPSELLHPDRVRRAHEMLPQRLRDQWIWWNLPLATPARGKLDNVIEDEPAGTSWFAQEKTEDLLSMMSRVNLAKVRKAQETSGRLVGTVYKRIRSEGGRRTQRAEVRFDQVSGCLRTPAGGSSRQTVLVVEGERIRSRLLSAREAARLMGLPESYVLPSNYNHAYHLVGDGVAVPVVDWLAKSLLTPLAETIRRAWPPDE